MHAHILSRCTAEEMKQKNFFPFKAAVISFHDPDDDPVDFSWATDRVLYVAIPF